MGVLNPPLPVWFVFNPTTFACEGPLPPYELYDPGACPLGPRPPLEPARSNWEKGANEPSVPWKNMAAMGGVEMISTVISSPMPPCCRAWLERPDAPCPVQALMMLEAYSAVATLRVMSSTSVLMKDNMASENMVPMPYSSHFWNKGLV